MPDGRRSWCCPPHLNNIVQEWATRVIWLDHGRIREDGPVDEVLAHYMGAEVATAPAPEPVAS